MRPIDRILHLLKGPTKSGGAGRYSAHCPGPLHKNGDRSRSLSVGEADSGAVLIHCFTGCTPADIVGALGIELSDLFPPRDPRGPYPSPETRAPLFAWKAAFSSMEYDLWTATRAFRALAEGAAFSPDESAEIARQCERLERNLRLVRAGINGPGVGQRRRDDPVYAWDESTRGT